MSRDPDLFQELSDAADRAHRAMGNYGLTMQQAGAAMAQAVQQMNQNHFTTFASTSANVGWWERDTAAEVDRLALSAVEGGLPRQDVIDIVQHAHARAAVEDHDEQWVIDFLRNELQRAVMAHTKGVSYHQDDDVAEVTAMVFMERVDPPTDVESWDAAMAELGKQGVEYALDLVERARQRIDVVTILEGEHAGTGYLKDVEDAMIVLGCALTETPVRMRVERTKPKPDGMKINRVPDHMVKHGAPPDREWYEATGRDPGSALSRLMRRS